MKCSGRRRPSRCCAGSRLRRAQARPCPSDVAGRLNNLALMLQKLGRTDEAETLLQDAIATGERTLGRDHPLVMTRLNNLASLLLEKGKLAEAEKLFRETIDRGAAHAWTRASRYRRQARQSRQSAAQQRALRRGGAALSRGDSDLRAQPRPHHQMTARIERNLAVLLLATGRADEALRYAQHALPVHDEISGRSHNSTRNRRRSARIRSRASAATMRPRPCDRATWNSTQARHVTPAPRIGSPPAVSAQRFAELILDLAHALVVERVESRRSCR